MSGVWIVEFDGELYGPLESADACYKLAAILSREPNDWQLYELIDPKSVEIEA